MNVMEHPINGKMQSFLQLLLTEFQAPICLVLVNLLNISLFYLISLACANIQVQFRTIQQQAEVIQQQHYRQTLPAYLVCTVYFVTDKSIQPCCNTQTAIFCEEVISKLQINTQVRVCRTRCCYLWSPKETCNFERKLHLITLKTLIFNAWQRCL